MESGANSFSGVLAFEKSEHPAVGFRFVTDAWTNIDDYVYQACMERVMPVIERACAAGIEVRQIMLSTHKIDTTNQMSLFFQEEEKLLARYRAIDEIKNRFGQKYITKANTMTRVMGKTHFLERNV